ncbi:MAG: putative LPS assembly protein LptD, partial [Bacteroidota bacterium]
MSTKLLKIPVSRLCLLLIFVLILHGFGYAQDTTKQSLPLPPSSFQGIKKKINAEPEDSVQIPSDTLSKIKVKPPAVKKAALKGKVDYSAKDSLRFDVKKRSVSLYNQADINYQDIKLKAAFVKIDFPENMVYAEGKKDSAGVIQQIPDFTQSTQTFKSKTIRYNYNTKQGYIQNVVTKQDEGYLHGNIVKKMENDITYLKDGTYTTCDLDGDPHFGFKFSKAKVIPGKRVITGPAYLTISGVPTPLAIPFGFFPNRTGRRSGILIPVYGESANRGFYFEGLGYYLAISDYMDLKIQGDIYTHGSWAIRPTYTYRSKYHFNGVFAFSYALNLVGTYGTPGYQRSNDFSVRWSHNQDPKARPHSNFSASVNIVSSTFNKYNLASTTTAYLSNTFQSSINYSTNFNNTYYLTLNFSHSQNTLQKTINITFPQLTFFVNQFTPFKRKVRVGSQKWYENISTKYNLDMQNVYNSTDTTFFKPGWEKKMQNGIRHTIPVSSTVRVLKYFNWTNSLNFADMMYFQSIRKRFVHDSAGGYYKTDTVPGFANAMMANFSSSLNTRL